MTAVLVSLVVGLVAVAVVMGAAALRSLRGRLLRDDGRDRKNGKCRDDASGTQRSKANGHDGLNANAFRRLPSHPIHNIVA